MVKIEHVWEEMENSCFCLGLGARQADGQARVGQENLDLRSSEYTPHLPDSREQSQIGRSMEASNAASPGAGGGGVHIHNAPPLPRH